MLIKLNSKFILFATIQLCEIDHPNDTKRQTKPENINPLQKNIFSKTPTKAFRGNNHWLRKGK